MWEQHSRKTCGDTNRGISRGSCPKHQSVSAPESFLAAAAILSSLRLDFLKQMPHGVFHDRLPSSGTLGKQSVLLPPFLGATFLLSYLHISLALFLLRLLPPLVGRRLQNDTNVTQCNIIKRGDWLCASMKAAESSSREGRKSIRRPTLVSAGLRLSF